MHTGAAWLKNKTKNSSEHDQNQKQEIKTKELVGIKTKIDKTPTQRTKQWNKQTKNQQSNQKTQKLTQHVQKCKKKNEKKIRRDPTYKLVFRRIDWFSDGIRRIPTQLF